MRRFRKQFLPLVIALFCAFVMHAADAAHGKEIFTKRCTGCHDLDRNKVGPHLRTVYGSTAGKADGFGYSDGMKAANFKWDDDSLNKWLANPDDVVKDNDMAFRLQDAAERADVIAYLKSLSNK